MISTTAYPKIKTKQKSWKIGMGHFWQKKKKKKVCFWGARWRAELQFLLLNMNLFFKSTCHGIQIQSKTCKKKNQVSTDCLLYAI